MLKSPYRILLLAALVLSAFYPSIHAEYNLADDLDLIRYFTDFGGLTFKEIFLPGSREGLYYRPLLALTFIFDYAFWSLHSSFMHLENVLLHLCNSLFVYCLARELLPAEERNENWSPFISACFFGLHPIAVESVSWISGRTDLLAGFFLFPAAFFTIRYKQSQQKWYLFLAFVAAILAFVSKESSLGFLLGAFFLGIARTSATEGAVLASRRRYILHGVTIFVVIVGGVALFFLLRAKAFSTNNGGINLTLQSIENNPVYSIMLVLRTYAFYLKKIFWPFPLNFTIVEVDPLYELVAFPLVALTCWIAFRRTLASALFLTGVGLIAPAFLIAFGQIAWTPYSERYVYLATGFIIPALIHVLGCYATKNKRVFSALSTNIEANIPYTSHDCNRRTESSIRASIVMLTVLLLIVSFVTTMNRTYIWSRNSTLYEDTARKNPDFKTARNLYGVALAKEGKALEAQREFAAARSLYSFHYDEKFDLNYAVMLVRLGEHDRALEVYRSVIYKTKGASVRAREGMLSVYLEQLSVVPEQEDREQLRRSIEMVAAELYKLNPNSEVLYSMGVASIVSGNTDHARVYFRTAQQKARHGSFIWELAGIKLRYLDTRGV
ncbi:MAG: hypothetical protein ED859_13715 [Desulfuromonadales bacterium]|nr:MAG: hypothetical protein ED859_13715 [Desulfuromonadales bacterium]